MLTAWFVPWLAGVSDYVLLQHGSGGSSPAYGLNMEQYPLAPSASPKHTDTYMLAHMCTQTHTQHTYRLHGCLGILVRPGQDKMAALTLPSGPWQFQWMWMLQNVCGVKDKYVSE